MKRPSWRLTLEESRRDLAAVGVPTNGTTCTIFHALRTPGTRLLLLHRLQAWVGAESRVTALVSSMIWNFSYVLSGCMIGRNAQIAGGVVFPHPTAIVIGNRAVIASGCWIYQSVTIGASQRQGMLAYPTLEARRQIFPGACVIGGIKLAPGTIVAANSVLLHSTEEDSMYAGSPASKVKDLYGCM